MDFNLSNCYKVRKMEIKDIPFFNKVRNQSRKYLHDNNEYSIYDSEDWFLENKPFFFVLSYMDNDIGYFRTSNWESNSLYIGLDIDKSMRGNGHAKSSYPLFIKFIEIYYGINHFFLRVLKSNPRAKHIYDKLGFKVVRETKIDFLMELKSDRE